jgi:hypothetical protein
LKALLATSVNLNKLLTNLSLIHQLPRNGNSMRSPTELAHLTQEISRN